jgi:hypothetical protein
MATSRLITNILPTIAPRLPAATVEWDHRFMEQYSNILRLYFNGIDTTFGGLLGSPSNGSGLHPGGGYLNFPYASVQRTTDQRFTAGTINTPVLVTFNQNDFLNDCTNPGTDGITVKTAGIYNYQYSIQWANDDTQIDTCYTWLRINGVDVAGTNSKFDVPAKHGSSSGYLIVAANFYVQLNVGDHVDLYAASPSTGCYMEAYAANSGGFTMPSIPSVVATLSFVSSVPT